MHPAERHQRQRHAVQHQLGREHHQDQVAAREEAERAQHEQRRADGQVAFDSSPHHSVPSGRRGAMAMAPIAAIKQQRARQFHREQIVAEQRAAEAVHRVDRLIFGGPAERVRRDDGPRLLPHRPSRDGRSTACSV